MLEQKKKALIVYASRQATENTRKIAEAIQRSLGDDCDIAPAAEAPAPDNYALVLMGFGVYRGWPDGDMRAYMRRCRNQDIGLFMTLGAWPDSEHAHNCMGRAEGLLDSCRVKARFIGHGRLDSAMIERMKQRPAGSPHSWDDERAKRVAEAEKHPDQADFDHAVTTFKKAWDKIKEVEPHAEKAERQAIVMTAFGTTFKEAGRAYDNIESAIAAAHPDTEIFRAYTSGGVRCKLAATGTPVKSVAGQLNDLCVAGYTSVKVISLHIVPGEEYHKMINEISAFRNSAMGFRRMEIGRPLLADIAAMHRVCDALTGIIPEERRPEDAVIFMGHGNQHGHGDFHYQVLCDELQRRDPNVFFATVEGGLDFSAVRTALNQRYIGKAYLLPFLVVAGDHARNDLAGEKPESWRSQLVTDGIEVVPVLRGLGEYDNFAALFAGRGE